MTYHSGPRSPFRKGLAVMRWALAGYPWLRSKTLYRLGRSNAFKVVQQSRNSAPVLDGCICQVFDLRVGREYVA